MNPPQGSLLVRLATQGDIPALQAIERSATAAFRGTPHPWVADDGVTGVEAYPPLIVDRTLWVAELGAVLVGFASATRFPDALHVLELAVHLDHQRKGIGRRLLEVLIGAARAKGLPAVTLTTFHNVAFNAPFYTALGFEIVERPSPRLLAILAAEAQHGLADRCAMRLALQGRVPALGDSDEA
jgi:GNAT superfamily N-acetyltransferase